MSASKSPSSETGTLEGEYAGFVTRAIAFVIDVLIIDLVVIASAGAVAMVLAFFVRLTDYIPGLDTNRFSEVAPLITSATAVIVMLVMIWFYPVVFWMIGGQTFGKRVMGLRVIRMDGNEMTFWQGFLRVLGYWFAAIPLFLGFIWVLFSNQRRGWHDHLAGTCVVYSWEAHGSGKMLTRLATGHAQRKLRRQEE